MDNQYELDISQWRKTMDDVLRQENGWLALAGLFWLEDGDNPFGTGADNQVILPDKAGIETIGHFRLEQGKISLVVTADVEVEVNGQTVRQAVLPPDVSENPGLIKLGDLQMMVIERSGQYAIRLWDNGRPERLNFSGRNWFPLQEAYRIAGTYHRFEQPTAVTIQRTLGAAIDMQLPGEIRFQWQGIAHQLWVSELPSGELSLMFKDATSGDSTYGAGRYLTIAAPIAVQIIVDFNRAYHPPCAVTDYATCPLPPLQNQLPFRVEAGECYA